ncbi:alpha/beta fold hydrolase [Salinispirillum sp. LH 10-3-1]|uniref:Alpha/beta fold hydrolase n=1 Tax=Salinispirillum sp. LH 10-3-1 TaxID=2952525 RepID=A0AB38YGV4_9GAMM
MDKPTETPTVDAANLSGLPQSLKALVGQVAERKADFPDLIVALSPLINNGSALPTETALELSVALHDIEVEAAEDDALHSLVNQQSAPSCAINAAGAVLALNVAAAQLFGLHVGDGIGQLGVNDTEWQDCQRRLAEVAGSTMLKVTRPGNEALPMIMIGRYIHRYQVFVLTALQHYWPEAVDKALEALFQLTRSEREVLSYLAQGQTAEQIAANRSRAVGTVRQQIKTLLEKMGSSTQVQAATLAAAAANALSDSPGRSDTLLLGQAVADLSFKEFIRDGRRVGWRRYGAAGGHPVIFLHGPFFGVGDFLADRQWAERLGLDVFALERPGYGRTDIPQRHTSVLDTMVEDILTLMAREDIPKAAFLTHEIGLIPALAIAQRAPERISYVLGVSAAPPFRELAQLNAMPSQQRIFIWAAQHAQWLVRLLIRLGMVRLRKLGPDHWMEAVFGEVAGDMAVLQRPELQPGIIGAYSYNVNQVGAGFEVDLQLMLSNWGDLIQQNHIPIHLLHGTDNQTTRLEYAEVFCQLNPHIQLARIEGSGQTLAVDCPDVVYRRLAELIVQTIDS